MIPTLAFGVATMSGFAANSVMAGISGLAGAGMSAAASEVAQGNMSHGVVRSNMINMNKYDAALKTEQGRVEAYHNDSNLTNNNTMQANTIDQNNYQYQRIHENTEKFIEDMKNIKLGGNHTDLQNTFKDGYNNLYENIFKVTRGNYLQNDGNVYSPGHTILNEALSAKDLEQFKNSKLFDDYQHRPGDMSKAEFIHQASVNAANHLGNIKGNQVSYTETDAYRQAQSIDQAISEANKASQSKTDSRDNSITTGNGWSLSAEASTKIYAKAGIDFLGSGGGAEISTGLKFSGDYTNQEQAALKSAYEKGDMQEFNDVLRVASARMKSDAMEQAKQETFDRNYENAHMYLTNSINLAETGKGHFTPFKDSLTGMGTRTLATDLTQNNKALEAEAKEKEQAINDAEKNPYNLNTIQTNPQVGGHVVGTINNGISTVGNSVKEGAGAVNNVIQTGVNNFKNDVNNNLDKNLAQGEKNLNENLDKLKNKLGLN